MTFNRRSTDSNTWTLTRAKAHFSRLIERAQTSPQLITQHGKPRVVMVSARNGHQDGAQRHARGVLAGFAPAGHSDGYRTYS